jgi:hypothetical protein
MQDFIDFDPDTNTTRMFFIRTVEWNGKETVTNDIPLTELERQCLAYAAGARHNEQHDVRYWESDPETRVVLRKRWKEIADALHINNGCWKASQSVGDDDDEDYADDDITLT